MTRGEATALGVAAAGHVVLFGLLSVGFLATPNPDKLEPTPIEVTLADDVALTSAAPEISSEAPAAKKSPVEAPLEPDTAPEPAPESEPAPPEPQPAPAPAPQPKPAPPKPAPAKPAPAKSAPAKPQPKPQPQPQPKPAPKAAPAKPSKPAPAAPAKPTKAAPSKPTKAAPAAPTRTAAAGKPAVKPAAAAPAKARGPIKPSGRLEGLDLGASDRPSPSKSNAQPAATVGPQVRSALQAEVIRQIKPHWTPPSGADSEKLRTRVVVSLNRDGSVAGEPRVTQTGVTDSNRVQAALHRERAIRAVKLAAPFKLPAQYYDGWKTIAPTLFEGL